MVDCRVILNGPKVAVAFLIDWADIALRPRPSPARTLPVERLQSLRDGTKDLKKVIQARELRQMMESPSKPTHRQWMDRRVMIVNAQDDHRSIERMCKVFVQNVPHRAHELNLAARERNAFEMCEVAQRLRTMLSVFSASLSEEAKIIENNASEGRILDAIKGVERILPEIEELRSEIAAFSDPLAPTLRGEC